VAAGALERPPERQRGAGRSRVRVEPVMDAEEDPEPGPPLPRPCLAQVSPSGSSLSALRSGSSSGRVAQPMKKNVYDASA
jgi:hypothetical protein